MISVLVPTFNGAEFLRTALISALGQDVNKEIIVVDDLSCDDTVSIACQYPVRVVRCESHLGLAGNWNRAMEYANGEWIKFLHQDDWLEPGCLRKMLGLAHSSKSPLLVCKRGIAVKEGTKVSLHRQIEKSLSPKEFRRVALKNLGKNFVGEPSCVMFHRDCLKLGWFAPSLNQIADWEFWLRLGSNYGTAFLPEELAVYRVHEGAESTKNQASAKNIEGIVLLHRIITLPSFLPLRLTALRMGINLKRWKSLTRRNLERQGLLRS